MQIEVIGGGETGWKKKREQTTRVKYNPNKPT